MSSPISTSISLTADDAAVTSKELIMSLPSSDVHVLSITEIDPAGTETLVTSSSRVDAVVSKHTPGTTAKGLLYQSLRSTIEIFFLFH